jgi:hypothetical protein
VAVACAKVFVFLRVSIGHGAAEVFECSGTGDESTGVCLRVCETSTVESSEILIKEEMDRFRWIVRARIRR